MTPDELAAALQAHPFKDMAEEVMRQITQIAMEKSIQFTPVDTGLLRTSESNRVEPGGMKGFVETDTPYAIYQKVDFFQLGADASVQPAEQRLQKLGVKYFDLVIRSA